METIKKDYKKPELQTIKFETQPVLAPQSNEDLARPYDMDTEQN